MAKTLLTDLVDTKVLGDIVTSGVPGALRFAGLAQVYDNLEGVPGSTLSFPSFNYIGTAEDVAEGEAIPLSKLTASAKDVKVKKAAKGVEITDSAVLSGYGDPLGEASEQLVESIADKVDDDLLESAKGAVQTAPTVDSVATLQVALDVFADEDDAPVAIVMNPADAGALRIDAGQNFIQGSAIGAERLTTGVYGDVLGVQILRSRKVEKGDFYLIKQGALALVSKREVEVESARDIVTKTTVITADKHYAAYLYDPSKVVKSSK